MRLEHVWTFVVDFVAWLLRVRSWSNSTRLQLKDVLLEYLPKIRSELLHMEHFYFQWLEEKCSYAPTLPETEKAKNHAEAEVNRLYEEMLAKIANISFYRWFYRRPSNPLLRISYPCPCCDPADFTAEPAVNYCDALSRTYAVKKGERKIRLVLQGQMAVDNPEFQPGGYVHAIYEEAAGMEIEYQLFGGVLTPMRPFKLSWLHAKKQT